MTNAPRTRQNDGDDLDARSAELDARERKLREREDALASGGQVSRQEGDGPRYSLELETGETVDSDTGEAYRLQLANGETALVDSPVSTEHNGVPVVGRYRETVKAKRDNRA